MPDEKNKNKPVIEFRARGVRASVWSREKEADGGRTYTEYSVSVRKSYKDKDGSWQIAKSFFPNDLPLLNLVVNQAFEFIMLRTENNESD